MAESTNISWSDKTWSPWTGCAKISPACDGCYAANLMDNRMGRVEWGEPGSGEGTRDRMSESYWRKALTWDKQAAAAGERPFIFPSLCDPFDTAVPPMWRSDFVKLMEATPNLVWLLLTKRIGNVRKLTDPARGERLLPPNHALGATFANQLEWDRDGWKLKVAAEYTGPLFTFASLEPMLSDFYFGNDWLPDWIIGGGETDQGAYKARPTHPQWRRNLRDQCADRGVMFHWKQNGEWISVSELEGPGDHFKFSDGATVRKVGRANSGRTIDGVVHDDRPHVPPLVARDDHKSDLRIL